MNDAFSIWCDCWARALPVSGITPSRTANDLVWSDAATYRSSAVESGPKPCHVLGTSGNNAWPLTSHEMPNAQLAAVSQ
ncbi:MAG: hypothetical protein QOF99_453 [Pseudonocardiales bacterium]|nr:hypothetical protein [Pseudonocardiales bacterium]